MRVCVRTPTVLALVWSACAFGHTHLVRSTPADGATLGAAPPEATLFFAQAVTLTSARLASTAGVKLTLTPPQGASAELHLKLPAVAPGRYLLSWRAASGDGHVISGGISFTISAPASH